jgi:hypothetical protein
MAAEPLVTPNSAGERAIARPAGYLLRRRAGLDVIAARLDGGDRRGSERATRDGPPVLGRTSGRISGNYPCATPLRTSTLRVVAKRSRERKTRCKERGRAVPPAVPLRPLAMVDVAERSARGTAASSSVDRTGALLSLSGEKGWSSPHFPLASPGLSLARVRTPPREAQVPSSCVRAASRQRRRDDFPACSWLDPLSPRAPQVENGSPPSPGPRQRHHRI